MMVFIINLDADSLNHVYVFESKMTLLLRISRSRAGFSRLVESNFIETLRDCKFIDQRPEIDIDINGSFY